jgi:hypothetical protein
LSDHATDPATETFIAHRNLLFTVAYELLGSAADAEDVLQETWLRWADSVRCHAAGNSSSSTIGLVAAWSVTTSIGATFVVPVARSKKRRAAITSRCADTSTSMTWPT